MRYGISAGRCISLCEPRLKIEKNYDLEISIRAMSHLPVGKCGRYGVSTGDASPAVVLG
jgi:hypothetical protein